MNEILHANIFFFITGIAVIILSAILCVLLFHAIKVLQSMRRIMDRIEEGTEVIAEDLGNVRAYFSGEGLIRKIIAKFMGSPATRDERGEKTKKQDRKKTELKIRDEA
jgi:5-bromo-4-chloroindolyl phosphate hydrolysis protein